MRVLSIRTAAVALAAGIGLSACAGPFGTGGLSVGYGNGGYYDPYFGGYSPYGYSPYGSSYRSGYSSYGFGYGTPYWGWYDGYYYPGTGYYVYDNWRRPRVWSDSQRRYWTERRERLQSSTGTNTSTSASTSTSTGTSTGTGISTGTNTSTGTRPILRPNWRDFSHGRASGSRGAKVERRTSRETVDRDRTLRSSRVTVRERRDDRDD